MISILERTLLHDDRIEGKIRHTLFDLLHQEASLTGLRLTSRILHTIVDQRKSLMFSNLYFCMPVGRLDLKYNIPALRRIAPFCTSMTIKVTNGDANSPYTMGEAGAGDQASAQQSEQRKQKFQNRRPARGIRNAHNTCRDDPPSESIAARPRRIGVQSSGVRKLDQLLLQQIFQSMYQLANLIIRVNVDSGWPGLTLTEDSLISIRLALEYSNLVSLRSVRLDPVHAAGVLHFRWAGFGAFREQPLTRSPASPFSTTPRCGSEIWTNLSTLDLRLRNPVPAKRLNEKQMMVFFQVLDDYLRSFRRTLRCLCFVWLDAPGPSPLAFADLLERVPIVWQRVQEFQYGNITAPEKILDLVGHRMPNLRRLESLVATIGQDCQDGDVWKGVDIHLPGSNAPTSETVMGNAMAKLSQLSLVPPPLSFHQTPTRADSPARSPLDSSSIYTHHELDLTGDPDIFDADGDVTVAMPSPSATLEEQRRTLQVHDVSSFGRAVRIGSSNDFISIRRATNASVSREAPTRRNALVTRAPVASSVYSRDENGDYIPVRHKWTKSAVRSDLRNTVSRSAILPQPPAPAATDAKAGLSTTLRMPASCPDTVLPDNKRVGRMPPPVPSSNLIARNKHLEIGDMPGFKAARDEYLRKISSDQANAIVGRSAEDDDRASDNGTISSRDRVRHWARAVKSGRPPSVVTTKSIDTFKTTSSRPLSKFFANLRETGRPPRQ